MRFVLETQRVSFMRAYSKSLLLYFEYEGSNVVTTPEVKKQALEVVQALRAYLHGQVGVGHSAFVLLNRLQHVHATDVITALFLLILCQAGREIQLC